MVYLVALPFSHDAHSAAEDHGMPTQRQVYMAGYYWYIPAAESKPIAEAYVGIIIKALTDPLKPEEIKPPTLVVKEYPSVTVTGDSYQANVEEFMRVFSANYWSDGLAIIPPTREAVDWMLTGTSRSPSEVIGPVAMRDGECTIEKIAINAVMVGAPPAYLPVIIAAMEAVADGPFDLRHPVSSLGGFGLVIWASGPIAPELGMNCGERLWTYGNRPNATIGRAIRTCMINMGHLWPGLNDMASQRVYPYTWFTFGEDYLGSPMDPYHVGQGYKASDSCITVSTNSGTALPSSVSGATAGAKIDKIISTILGGRAVQITNYQPIAAIPSQALPKYVFLVTPEMAADILALGYTQGSLRTYIYEKTCIPYEDLTAKEVENVKSRIDISKEQLGVQSSWIHPDDIPKWEMALKPGGKIPMIWSPKMLHFIVGGGAGKNIWQWSYYCRAAYSWSSNETRKIRGATMTKAGR